jgi:hypothetical protein
MTLRVFNDVEQRTEAWHDLRRGIVTASAVGQLLTVGAPDPLTLPCRTCGALVIETCISLTRKTPTLIKTLHPERLADAAAQPAVIATADNDTSANLTRLLTAERITGHTDPTFISDDMWRGIDDEPHAVDVYSEHHAPVAASGFMVRDDWGFSIGYSPDGLVGNDGLVEVKSRRQKIHLQHVLADEVPAAVMPQLQCALLVSGREWCDYISYSGGMALWTKRVTPDEQWFRAIVGAVAAFEKAAEEMADLYLKAVDGLPMTERIETEMVL